MGFHQHRAFALDTENWLKLRNLLPIIGSPICHRASVKKCNLDRGMWVTEQTQVVLHLSFVCELCETQVHGGRYSLLPYPHSADCHDHPLVVDFMNMFPNTFQTLTDSCLFGPMVSEQGTYKLHSVKTPTRWLTNSGCIAQLLTRFACTRRS